MNNFLGNIPPVVKNLLIINVLMLFLSFMLESTMGIHLNSILGLHYMESPFFKPLQIITHMFMHGNFLHLLFNMYALWMFGSILENTWGGKRFFIYYFITGFGAAFLHMLVNHLEIQSVISKMDPADVEMVLAKGAGVLEQGKNYIDPYAGKLNLLINIPVVGASGAVFGLLLAFGMLFPNIPLMLMFIPVPIKAKYFVIGYGLIELFGGLANRAGDNVAHFAHLGGMIFGFLIIKFWYNKRNPSKFY